MKLTHLGPNHSIVELNNGTQIGFSYQTPVAAQIDGKLYRTEQRHSVTTSKHTGKLLCAMRGRAPVEIKPQSFFDKLGE